MEGTRFNPITGACEVIEIEAVEVVKEIEVEKVVVQQLIKKEIPFEVYLLIIGMGVLLLLTLFKRR